MKLFSLIYSGDLHLADEGPVIPAEDYSTLMTASEVVELAREDAAAYKRTVEEECQRLRSQAQEEGFQEGLIQFHTHILAFEKELAKIRHEANKLILPIALKAARKIVGGELQMRPEAIVDIVLQALAPVTQNKKIVLCVNRADKEMLEQHKPEIRALLEQVESLSIVERPEVSPGGCIIETETGIINATIESQWRALEAAFERYTQQ
jgi:type III secretion protein L